MRIIVDAMGGDNAPEEIVKGALYGAKEYGVSLLFTGDSAAIEGILKKENHDNIDIEVVHTDEIITNNDHPSTAIRRKKNSSMVVGMRLLKEGRGDAFISAGNTGALLAGGLFVVGRLRGIDRPALAPVVPGRKGPFMLLDVGANADCKPENILQFALMGDIYARKILHKEKTSIGLVNIGTEKEKGNEFTKECYRLLSENFDNFAGNTEGRDIPEGRFDVVVCDGFTGNTVLKVFEGVAETIFNVLKEGIMSNARYKIGGLLLKPVFKKFKKDFDYSEYGGAILLGVKNPVIKAHGSSNAKAFKNAVRQAVDVVNGNIIDSIEQELKVILKSEER